MSEISIQDLESCNELITRLITLRSILKDTIKTENIIKLEIKKLEQKKINKLREETFITTLRNKHLGKSSYDIDEEETDLTEQAKQRIDKIEESKKDVKWGPKAAKMLQNLKYEKNDEIAVIAEKVWNIKKLINLLNKY